MPSSRRASAAARSPARHSDLRGHSPASLGFSSDGGGAGIAQPATGDQGGATFLHGDSPGPMTGTMGGALGYNQQQDALSTDAQRRLARKERNRIAAQASRDRKKEQLETLEQENQELRRQMATMQRRIEALETLLEEYQQGHGHTSTSIASSSKRKATSQSFLPQDYVDADDDDGVDQDAEHEIQGQLQALNYGNTKTATSARGKRGQAQGARDSPRAPASPSTYHHQTAAVDSSTSQFVSAPRPSSRAGAYGNVAQSGSSLLENSSIAGKALQDAKMDDDTPDSYNPDDPEAAASLGFAPPKVAARRESIGFRSAISTLAGMRSSSQGGGGGSSTMPERGPADA
ncbi:hypothetical protein ACM66B_007081 [Microbotryomycetes sp. NB124-2]